MPGRPAPPVRGSGPEKIRPPSVASIDISRGQMLIAFVTFASVDRPFCGHIVTEQEQGDATMSDACRGSDNGPLEGRKVAGLSNGPHVGVR